MRSHTLRPILDVTESPVSPIRAPCIVMTTDPLAPEFTLRVVLDKGLASENVSLTLTTYCPALIDTSRLLNVPDPASHLTEVSDSHAVRSEDERPSLPAVVALVSPSPAPRVTIVVDPADPEFGIPSTLTIKLSVEKATLALPT